MRKTLVLMQTQLMGVREFCAKLPAELLEILEIVQFVQCNGPNGNCQFVCPTSCRLINTNDPNCPYSCSCL
ncbi:hypothetical protein TNCT_159671 [Trichonephila clavata]|uniref:Uncharacterized protein n=1 Tax=Trichonephila clavata TaxID=2740835 RepID=A0A8X6LKQ0_TRICU|nr:hypothetical protein TNCT_159671 [Trichonephila clavata]